MNKNAHASSAAADLKKTLGSCANIAWYPSCGEDYSVFDVFTPEKLAGLGVPAGDAPDCVIMTDYMDFVFERFEKHLLYHPAAEPLVLRKTDRFTAALFNLRRLRSLNIPFYADMVGGHIEKYYGNVYTGDVLTESSSGEKHICRLVAACAENTAFALNYLIPKKITVKTVIRSNYGYGFGGGRSCGIALPYLFRDLGVRYFANDENCKDSDDDAMRYLSAEQLNCKPELHELGDLSAKFGFRGYDNTILYRVEGYGHAEEII